jgi:subfamily B ATP-binding cassette protein MsbA
MSVIPRIFQFTRPYHHVMLGGLLMMVFSTLLDNGVLLCFSVLLYMVVGAEALGRKPEIIFNGHDYFKDIDRMLHVNDPLRAVTVLALFTAVVILVKCAMDARQSYLMNKFANLVGRELRQKLFEKVIRFSAKQYDLESTGAMVSRITNDVVLLQNLLGPQLGAVVQAPMMTLQVLGMMLLISWKLTLTTLLIAPMLAGVLSLTGRMTRNFNTNLLEMLEKLNSGLVETISNVRTVQSFAREQFESDRMRELNQNYYRGTLRTIMLMETTAPSTEFVAMVGMILGVVIGAYFVYKGNLASAAFIAFVLFAQRGGAQIKQLTRVNMVRMAAEGMGDRLFSLLDTEPVINDAPHAQPLPSVQGYVTFEHVHFRYGEGPEVLHDLDFTVKPGEVIALVGHSGAGKTTIINLLPRFYDPTAGRILIDGCDLRDVTLQSLREQIGTVPQEPILFSGTIAENIRYGKLDATDEELVEAARAANAMEFVERLPEGMQTIVGERGMRLSGGQRQRVAIARAVLKNPRILILDEATSALDTQSERLVQDALDRLMVSRTSFVIAHRLSTVRHASRILVMDGGHIIEDGTHDALLEQNGTYRRLYDMQFKTAQELAADGMLA